MSIARSKRAAPAMPQTSLRRACCMETLVPAAVSCGMLRYSMFSMPCPLLVGRRIHRASLPCPLAPSPVGRTRKAWRPPSAGPSLRSASWHGVLALHASYPQSPQAVMKHATCGTEGVRPVANVAPTACHAACEGKHHARRLSRRLHCYAALMGYCAASAMTRARPALMRGLRVGRY